MYIIYNSLNHTLSPCRVHIENVWSKVRESGKFMRRLYCWILNLGNHQNNEAYGTKC